MQIVIEIPEDVYKHIMEMQFCIRGIRSGKGLLNKILYAIRAGTPLPKHGRLFDERDIVNGNYEVIGNKIYELEPIIEADEAWKKLSVEESIKQRIARDVEQGVKAHTASGFIQGIRSPFECGESEE